MGYLGGRRDAIAKERQRMRLSKTGYYADFVIYATIVTTTTIVTAWRNSAYEMSLWLLTAAVGTVSWTLFEYILHRFVLHQIEPFAAMHDAHHQAPQAYVGTPTWLSLGVILGVVFLPAWALGSFNTASGLAVGVMAGFFWYGVVHHAIHYRRPRPIATRLIMASRRHAQHHYSAQSGNFGVTTSFWDHAFGTTLSVAGDRTVQAE
jgi:sterol desaturase/sphingolipid hydroxylase (fatty acid hydroxylase superfamily)